MKRMAMAFFMITISILVMSCSENDKDKRLEGCAGLAERAWECDVYPAEFYEKISQEQYESLCEEDKEERVVACLLDCNTEDECDLFYECFVACNESPDAGN